MEKPFATCPKLHVCTRYKLLGLVFLLLVLSCMHQQSTAQQVKHPQDTVITKATQAKVFAEPDETDPRPYGGMQNFYHFIGRRITFDNTVERQRAIVMFTVEKDGSLTHIRIFRSNMSKELNAQIVRALYMSPAWAPGTQNGQPIRVEYTFPVTNY